MGAATTHSEGSCQEDMSSKRNRKGLLGLRVYTFHQALKQMQIDGKTATGEIDRSAKGDMYGLGNKNTISNPSVLAIE